LERADIIGRHRQEIFMLDFLAILFAKKSDRRGATALEYALIASVLGAIMVVGAATLGGDI
jgi:hypothetical protein